MLIPVIDDLIIISSKIAKYKYAIRVSISSLIKGVKNLISNILILSNKVI
jgi:hypothetical protein